MPRNIALRDLITRSQQRCDRENDGHISRSEWQSLISSSYAELYTAIVESGMRYFETEATITATGATQYALPSDHLTTIGMDYKLNSGNQRRSLAPSMVQERVRWKGLTGDAFAYALVGQFLELYPTPSSGTYYHLYTAQSPDLTAYAMTDNVDVVIPDGEEFLIWCTAVKALAKSEADTQLAEREREQRRAAVQEWACLRFLNEPRRRVETNAYGLNDYGMPWDSADIFWGR